MTFRHPGFTAFGSIPTIAMRDANRGGAGNLWATASTATWSRGLHFSPV